MRVAIARIVAPQGVRGEVRVLPLTDFPDRFAGREVWLGQNATERVRIKRARPHKAVWLLKLDGCDTRDQAERLRGVELLVDETELMPLGEEEFYVHELVGLPVSTDAGEPIGELAEVLRTGANDVYVVRSGSGREYLIPAVRHIVRVEREAGRVIVHPIPGLLD